MDKETVIKTKARQFTKYAFESSEESGTETEGAEIFWGEFEPYLRQQKTTINKVIFLHEAKIWLTEYLAEHQKKCNAPNCIFPDRINHCLFYIDQEIELLPQIISQNNIVAAPNRDSVFVSYSHLDKKYLEHFKRHFGTLKNVDFWEDSRIKSGDIWIEEIEKAMKKAKVAILFLSVDFFNSDFIINEELPKLLEAANKEGATILCVYLKSFFAGNFPEITKYQGINNPKNPIVKMNDDDKEEMWTAIVERVNELLVNKVERK
jgi:hypothetical protein